MQKENRQPRKKNHFSPGEGVAKEGKANILAMFWRMKRSSLDRQNGVGGR